MSSTQPAAVPTEEPGNHRGKALVVDDGDTNRLVLKGLLKRRGFDVIEADNGAEAVARFREEQPDIVFMDIMMPVMDGYEATRQIKAACGSHFVPIIFLTGITDEAALARCIEVGGDDFLTKPFKHTVLEAKIQAMERIRALNQEVSVLYNHKQREEDFAESVFRNAVLSSNVALDAVRTILCPASTFSGDMLLTAYTPSRDLHVLLGDFTGHGLGAALGALPASEVFRTMTTKGFSGGEILGAINTKLNRMLPTGMFMAAQFVRVSPDLRHITICNCGMPEILVVNGAGHDIIDRIPSSNLALGISAGFDPHESVKHISLNRGDRIILASDGVTEAFSPTGESYGQERFEGAITRAPLGTYIIDQIAMEIDQFCGPAPQADDISIVEVPLVPELLPKAEPQRAPGSWSGSGAKPIDELELSMVLHGTRLREVNPVPLLLSQIQELENFTFDREALYTILNELYMNAVDHGVLQLDPDMKSSPEGFARHFAEREARLREISDGWVRLSVDVQPDGHNGCFRIRVEDSGDGFDYEAVLNRQQAESNNSSSGLSQVREFSDSLEYVGCGNEAVAIYRWSDV